MVRIHQRWLTRSTEPAPCVWAEVVPSDQLCRRATIRPGSLAGRAAGVRKEQWDLAAIDAPPGDHGYFADFRGMPLENQVGRVLTVMDCWP